MLGQLYDADRQAGTGQGLGSFEPNEAGAEHHRPGRPTIDAAAQRQGVGDGTQRADPR